MTPEERHQALADCTPSAIRLWHAIAALTLAGQPRTRAALSVATRGMPERTMKRAKAELLEAGLLEVPRTEVTA